MDRKDEPHDHRVRSNSVDAHYDFLREAGYGREKAKDWAERATQKLIESQDGAQVAPTAVPTVVGRSPFKVPYFGEFANRLCAVLPDGSLRPVDEPCKCGAEASAEPHPCPYDKEMNGGEGEPCWCCASCESECSQDV